MTGRRGKLYNRIPTLVERSPLRRADPRTKLAISLCISLAAMLPIERLAIFAILYLILITWARLLPTTARQTWRLKWILLALFLLDWWMIGIGFAIAVMIRLILMVGGFTLLIATVTPIELLLALDRLRLPYRYAFSLSLAFQSLGLLEEEWQAINEAQRSRGILSTDSGQKRWTAKVSDLVSLTVPAIVLTAKRAWSLTESAHARGFDSPNRRPYRSLTMSSLDWVLFAATIAIGVVITFWRP